jgi:hypothetical protein
MSRQSPDREFHAHGQQMEQEYVRSFIGKAPFSLDYFGNRTGFGDQVQVQDEWDSMTADDKRGILKSLVTEIRVIPPSEEVRTSLIPEGSRSSTASTRWRRLQRLMARFTLVRVTSPWPDQ